MSSSIDPQVYNDLAGRQTLIQRLDTCSTCKYWQRSFKWITLLPDEDFRVSHGMDEDGVGYENPKTDGTCRLRSPVYFFTQESRGTAWPETEQLNWCGEYANRLVTALDEWQKTLPQELLLKVWGKR